MQSIQSLISKTIKSLYGVDFTPEISPAPKPELGEYCIGVFQLAKPLGKAPNMIAEELATELAKHTETFTSTSSTGGYVNFFLADAIWMDIFASTKNQEPRTKNQTIVVDYIGANVGKPLHIGHICTPSIGQVVCNVYRHLGYRVIGDSHFGDWGGIFGKLIYLYKISLWRWERDGMENDYGFKLNEEDSLLYSQYTNIVLKHLNEVKPEKILNIHKIHQDQLKANKEQGYEPADQFILGMYLNYIEATYFCENFPEIDAQCRLEFKKLSEGDELNVGIWKLVTKRSIKATSISLELLNVHADYNIGESFYEGLALPRPNNEDYPDLKDNMKSIVVELINKGIATQNEDGSVGVIFPEDSKLPSCILQKKDGTGLYLTSDLAAIKYRLTNGWNPSKIIYSVDVRQQLHLKQAFWIARAAWPELGADKVEFFHAFNGFIKLKEGAMSTRHGTVIFLEALIEEGKARTQKILEEKGRTGENKLKDEDIQAITVGAIKYSYLAQDREKDVVFDWDKALNFEGNSGPYIQYAFVRARKIGGSSPSRGGQEGYSQDTPPTPSYKEGKENTEPLSSSSLKLSPYDKSLIQSLARFDETVTKTAETYKPHHLALYAYELAVTFNGFYVHTPKILEEKDEDLKNLRLSLVAKTASTLEKAFDLLGIKMPSEM